MPFFTLILGGNYSERFGSQTKSHAPMSLLWHRAGVFHKDRIGAEGARCFIVEIKPSGIENLQQYSKVPLDFVESGTPMVWLAARLFREFKDWGTCSELVAEGLTLEMLGSAAGRDPISEKSPPRWLSKIVDRLNDEFADNISISDLAINAGVHPVYLASVFRTFHQKSIGEYVRQLRVSHASRLLIDPELPLAEIAYDAGFADQSHFNRIFKRHTGFTPGKFRNSFI